MIWHVGLSTWQPAKNTPELCDLLSSLPPEPIQNNQMPKTWLVESILVTCLCCLPFGIVGIVNATKVESAYQKEIIIKLYHILRELNHGLYGDSF